MKENAEYPLSASAEGAGLSGGQPQNYQSLKDRPGSAVMSTLERRVTDLCEGKSGSVSGLLVIHTSQDCARGQKYQKRLIVHLSRSKCDKANAFFVLRWDMLRGVCFVVSGHTIR